MQKSICYLFLSLLFISGVAQAQNETTWNKNAENSNWNDPNNWDNGIPSSNSNVKINFINIGNGGHEPVLNNTTTINSLSISSNNQTLQLNDNVTLTLKNSLKIGYSGTLNVGNGNLVITDYSKLEGNLIINSGNLTALHGLEISKSFTQNSGTLAIGNSETPADFIMNGMAAVTLGNVDMTVYGSADLNNKTFTINSGAMHIYQGFNIAGAFTFNLNQASLTIDGDTHFGSGSVFNTGSGSVEANADFIATNGSEFNLDQGDFSVSGTTSFDGGTDFNGGTGTLSLHNDVLFRAGQSFVPQQSNVIIDGSAIEISNANHNEISFYNLNITSGTDVTAKLPVIVEHTMTVQGSYLQTLDSSQNIETGLDVIGEVKGAENISTTRPYLVSLEVIDSHTLQATFNKPLFASTVKAANFKIKDGIASNAAVVDNISQNPSLSNGNVVTITTDNPISENENFVLWVKGDQNLYYEPSTPGPNAGVTGTNTFGLSDPHKKRFVKDFVVWKGTLDTNWQNSGNWTTSNGEFPSPSGGLTVRFDVNVAHPLKLKVGENPVLKSIENTSAEGIDLNGEKLYLKGKIEMTGPGKLDLSKPGSTLILAGDKLQTISANDFQNGTVNNLLIDNSGEGVQISDSLKLTGVLTLKNGKLNTNGKLKFKSSANKTAILAPIENGQIVGNVSVERYYPPRRAFRFVTSPVTTTTSINANWQEGVHNTGNDFPTDNQNPHPGYGTHITGSTTGQNGLDATPSGNPSLYQYDNASQTWQAITNTENNILEAGTAYRLMIRGDRGINVTSNSATPTHTILRSTGQLLTGNQQISGISSASNAYNMVSNPYQAVVDMEKVMQNSQGLKSSFYVWDPTQNTRGAYVIVDAEDGSHTGNSEANNLLQPGMAFFVQTKTTASTASLQFKESFKTLDTIPLHVFSPENHSNIRVDLYTDQALSEDAKTADGVLIKFSNTYANAVDDNDAQKLGNLDENLAIVSGNNFLSIEKRNLPTLSDTIHLFNNQYRTENYTYQIKVNNLNGVVAYLKDTYLGTRTKLENNALTSISFSVNSDIPESIATDRFEIVYEEAALGTAIETAPTISLYPNPIVGNSFNLRLGKNTGKVAVQIYSMLGQNVYQSESIPDGKGEIHLDHVNLQTGIYMVKVRDEKGNEKSLKLIKK